MEHFAHFVGGALCFLFVLMSGNRFRGNLQMARQKTDFIVYSVSNKQGVVHFSWDGDCFVYKTFVF